MHLFPEIARVNFTVTATGQFPAERFFSNKKPEEQTKSDKKMVLTSKDELFQHLRDKNFNAVGPVLKSKAKQITEQYDVS